MKDLISIIVPMHNAEKYLERTLQSLLSQTYRNVEILLVNDGPDDGTHRIASTYLDQYRNIRLIEHQNTGGMSSAINEGLKICRGEYIVFVDSGHFLTKQALEILYRTAKENKADLVLGIYKELYPNRVKLHSMYTFFPSLTSHGRIYPTTNPEIFLHMFAHGKLCKRELLEGFSFPIDVDYTESQAFSMYTYLHAKRIYVAPYVVQYYPVRADFMTQSALQNPTKYLQSSLRLFECIRGFFGDFPDSHDYDVYLSPYFSQFVQGNIRFPLEIGMQLQDQSVLRTILNMLKQWIQTLDDYLFLKNNSLITVFVNPVQTYLRYLTVENQRLYRDLLRVIRDRKLAAIQKYSEDVAEKNRLLDSFLENVDRFIVSNHVAEGKEYFVSCPEVTSVDKSMGRATVRFRLVELEKESVVKIGMARGNAEWVPQTLLSKQRNESQKVRRIRCSAKPKILLTYRDYSGCNTFALYKSMPPRISENYDVEIIAGNKATRDYVNKILESDIVVTTNMEYPAHVLGSSDCKTVLDLWHGFPLKNMFFTDPNYRDKNTIASYWAHINYLTSYSELYTRLVSRCFRVNPKRFVITGAPRNDLLFGEDSREKLVRFLDLNDSDKIIFYLPTFRTSDMRGQRFDNIFGFPRFDLKEFIAHLDATNSCIVIKAHPIVRQEFRHLLGESSRIKLIESNDLMNSCIDLYEILGGSDMLITDYSSVYFDYLLLDKPVVFCVPDLHQYRIERGFILDSFDEWTPGPKVVDQDGLQNAIAEVRKNMNEYRNMRNYIKDRVHFYQDAGSTERVWSLIESLVEKSM